VAESFWNWIYQKPDRGGIKSRGLPARNNWMECWLRLQISILEKYIERYGTCYQAQYPQQSDLEIFPQPKINNREQYK
jgi:hypothetical protein